MARQLRVLFSEMERKHVMESSNSDTAWEQEALPWERLPLVDVGQGLKMLAGVKILDVTTSVAGPYATMLLSDLGADVIKVERPEGDDARQWGPPFLDGQALWFSAINRNKKSVALDLSKVGQRLAFEQLIAESDVFVTNQPPDVQRKLKLDYGAVRAIREDIIFASISGFGLTGTRSEMVSYDLIAEGYSGIMDITGAAESPPQKIGAPAADMLAGQDAAMAVLAALYERRTTGRGHKIDVSLADSMTRFLTCRIASYLGSGEVPQRSGGTDSVIAIYQSFETADEPINLGLGSNAIWRRFWTVLKDVEYGQRPEFRTNEARRGKREEIVARIQAHLYERTRAEWLEIFAQNRIPAGPINRINQVVHDPLFHERGMFFALRDGERVVPQVGLGIQFDGKFAVPRSAAPHLGQHTDHVLSALKND
jgi:crotonobetainyl-CoA:carnitine CoA-transferase CaiB-like acyl-CoA transferase